MTGLPGSVPSPMVSGLHRLAVRALIWCQFLWCALKTSRLVRVLRVALGLRALARDRGLRLPARCVKVAGRYFSSLFSPGWPSLAFNRQLLWRLRQLTSPEEAAPAPPVVFLAITKACPLRCQHCYEGPVRGHPDTVSVEQLESLLRDLQARGVSQLLFTGGEPMSRFPALLRLLRGAAAGTDFWVFTSGFGLTKGRARLLAEAGLTGVVISLDHWDPARHDAFRGMHGSYERALWATHHAREAGLVVALSLCATAEFISQQYLRRYAGVAHRLGAGFIQLLEPRASGAFAGKEVALSESKRQLLETFTMEMNLQPARPDLPVVEYPAWVARQVGCQGAARQYLYIDTDGRLRPCPFSTTSAGSAIEGDLDLALAELRRRGCGLCAAPTSDTTTLAQQPPATGGADEDPIHRARVAQL